jgi:hypothetical protein
MFISAAVLVISKRLSKFSVFDKYFREKMGR